jgi:polyhydroxyalkanoate synthase
MATTTPLQAASTSLDVLLTDSTASGTRRFLAPGAIAGVAAGAVRHPRKTAGRAAALGGGLARVAAGRSEQDAARGDRRFADPAWQQNWLLRRVMQGYLTTGEAVDGLIADAELDWQTERQARFAAGNVLDAVAPTNFPLTNPAVLRAIVDEGGANLVRGVRNFAADVARPPRLPQSVDTSQFEVGGNLAATPGSVVLHTEVFELIQYRPATEQVHAVPLLFIPPTINKYYILDLAPGRSLVEYLVGQGMQVFVISWRNPDEEHAHFDLDTYADAVLEARDAVATITQQPAVHLNAACSGGIITASAVGHLAAEGALGDVASLTLFVSALDSARAGTAGAFMSRDVAAAAIAESARRGYVDGQALAGVFAWLRPNDLVWNYVVNNYLLGKTPPAFDVLYWNQDAVRLAAGLHRDFVRLALDNSLARPDALTVLGSPVDLGSVDMDSYIVAGLKDHIVPWENAYRSTQLLGGDTKFVLSTSGHIQAMVNPPAPDSRASYRVGDEYPADPQAFLDSAVKVPGSWWPDYAAWLAERSGAMRRAPKRLGGRGHRALGKAPGTYVYAS